MCKVIVELRKTTAPTPLVTLPNLSERSLPQSSLGLSVQPCITATVGRQTCASGQWASLLDSTSGDWKDLIGLLKSQVDEQMSEDDENRKEGILARLRS